MMPAVDSGFMTKLRPFLSTTSYISLVTTSEDAPAECTMRSRISRMGVVMRVKPWRRKTWRATFLMKVKYRWLSPKMSCIPRTRWGTAIGPNV